MSSKKVYLSASRIKTAQQCSWTYWCKYILKLPDRGNDGASKGTICHLLFEVLGCPRRKRYFDKIVENGSIWCVESVKRLVLIYANKLGVNTEEHLEDIDKMVVNGLNFDFFGEDGGNLKEGFSEKSFNLSISEGSLKYNIRGFIDKLFLYKDKKAIIRDFKSSKQKFKGKEITDNMQDLMYCLAIKKLFPEYSSISEFLFLKFDLGKDLFGNPGSGAIKMKALSEEVLEGFEYELTEIQKFLDNFSDSDARSNFAAKQNYPKDGTFGGPLACGKDGFKMSRGEEVLDKSGKPIKAFICGFRKPFEYYVLLSSEGDIKKSVYKEDVNDLNKLQQKGDTIEKRKYKGCPHWENKSAFSL
jgi:hypothetical protein